MADVQPDATQTPAPEGAPAPVAEAATASPEPAPAEDLNEVVQAAADSTVEAVAAMAQPVLEAPESVVDSAKSMASQVADAVVDVAGTVTQAARAASSGPELESTTVVPATGAEEAHGEGGGEWELLLGKVQAWLGQGKLQDLWAQARNPISLILAAAALLVVLRVYSALLAAIDSLPLIPGLLELVGVIWAVRFGVPKLVQRSQRQELISGIQQRWESFRGRG
jgi:hypothetical protein